MGSRTMLVAFRVKACDLFFLPCTMRVPLKFGAETIASIVNARVCLHLEDTQGKMAYGWGETPLSVAWAWPSAAAFKSRENRMLAFCETLAEAWRQNSGVGHAMEVGWEFLEQKLPVLLAGANAGEELQIPHLAALICNSAFDLALHDAYGKLLGKPIYETYNQNYLSKDLAWYFEDPAFAGKYPEDFLLSPSPSRLPVWHLVGGKDLLTEAECTGQEPQDGYPVTLTEWIKRDGLYCLKIKLTGVDAAWDFQRMVSVGNIALQYHCSALSPDLNCQVRDPVYVNELLDRLQREYPAIYDLILYVEQPFPYDLEANRMDVHSVSRRKPLFMDESAHDWRLVRLGWELGWTGVALKVCKTQTGALLSACWAKAHGMQLMVQDLTNPRLALIPHVLLAAKVGTIMGVECNAAQFYPEASKLEAESHPGLYERRNGELDLTTIRG
ncbi:MAG: hypothetical protein WCT05_07325, partial [Lentisphaeria bacterium]